jgi:hypothetical protein
MPIVADLVLCLGAFYAMQSRKGLIIKPSRPADRLYSGPHFNRMAKKQQVNH